MTRMARQILIIGGTAAWVLGIIGIFIPLLPTTHFLLLAAACYARSSERFYRALLANRWCGPVIRSYREGRGIPLKQKIITLVLLWVTIGYAATMVVSALWLRVLLLGIAGGVTVHILTVGCRRGIRRRRCLDVLSSNQSDPGKNQQDPDSETA